MAALSKRRAEAVKRREAALAEYNFWDEFIRQYDDLGNNDVVVEKSPYSRKKGKRTVELTTKILQQNGNEFMPSPVLLTKLQEQGDVIEGKNPIATLMARLNHHAKGVFENKQGYGWRLMNRSTNGL